MLFVSPILFSGGKAVEAVMTFADATDHYFGDTLSDIEHKRTDAPIPGAYRISDTCRGQSGVLWVHR